MKKKLIQFSQLNYGERVVVEVVSDMSKLQHYATLAKAAGLQLEVEAWSCVAIPCVRVCLAKHGNEMELER